MRCAFCKSAAACTYTWQIPSPCPSTGILLCREIFSTNSFPPRGISKSTSRCRFSSSITSSRECSICAVPSGTSPESASASRQIVIKTSFVRAASVPPFSKIALPDFSASEATCGTTSGRDSNTTATTPSGQLSRVSTNP